MASLYKPMVSTYVLPNGAHRTPDGKRVTVGTPGAVKVSRKSKVWYGKYTDAAGVPHRVRLSTNHETAKVMLAKLVTDAALGKVGAIDPYERHNQRDIDEHVAEWELHLRTTTNMRGHKNTDEHIDTLVPRVRKAIQGCGFRCIKEISAGPVELFIGNLTREIQGEPVKLGAQTRNFYLQAMQQFCLWLVSVDRLARNPLAKVNKENVENDQKHPRRAFSGDELPRIFTATINSAKTFRGLTGADRAALYATAMGTGFRVKELASLTPASFDLDKRTVEVSGEVTKNRKAVADRPIPADLAAHLREYLHDKDRGQPIWGGTWCERAAGMFKRDLAAARKTWIEETNDAAERAKREASDFLAYVNAAGEYGDFHAWRHTFVSVLMNVGVNPKAAQELSRHSDMKLVMQRYAHAEQQAMAKAVDMIPQFLGATGTDGPSVRLDRALTNKEGAKVPACVHESPRAENREVDEVEQNAGNCPALTTEVPAMAAGVQSDENAAKNEVIGFLNRRSQVRILPGVMTCDDDTSRLDRALTEEFDHRQGSNYQGIFQDFSAESRRSLQIALHSGETHAIGVALSNAALLREVRDLCPDDGEGDEELFAPRPWREFTDPDELWELEAL